MNALARWLVVAMAVVAVTLISVGWNFGQQRWRRADADRRGVGRSHGDACLDSDNRPRGHSRTQLASGGPPGR